MLLDMSRKACAHIKQVNLDAKAKTKGCEEREKIGDEWVHLRLVYHVVMLDVVILRKISTPLNTSEALNFP